MKPISRISTSNRLYENVVPYMVTELGWQLHKERLVLWRAGVVHVDEIRRILAQEEKEERWI